ncbi:MAG: hypothetical protein HN458_01320 [Euryarchaeota archaeon]|nr:hypothetical protein [Euryarchaeota archaeon]
MAENSRRLRVQTLLCLAIFLVGSVSTVAGQYSDIAFVDVTVTPGAEESRTVDINANETYIASGYDGLVAIHSLTNLELVESFAVDGDVLDIKFSPDGSMLAFAMSGSITDTDTIQIIDVDSRTLTAKQSGSNSRSESIQWSPDGHILAVPNSNNGVNLLRTSDMEVERTLNGEHNTKVTCIDFSSLGSYILTGDESGRVVMWTLDGNPTGKQWDHDSKILSCDFDSSDEKLAVLTEQGEMAIWSFSGGALGDRMFEGGARLHWSVDDKQIHVLETGSSQRILTIDSSTFSDVVSVYLAHQGMDFDIVENQFGTRQLAYVATDTGHIAVYGAAVSALGQGESGADLDGDEIPDEYDDDDDGDAIPDARDNNCETFTQACSKNPDVDTIRQISIRFNSTAMVLEDTFTLDTELSSAIRNLSRRSIVTDAQLSEEEAVLFADATCKNMNQNHYLGSWKDAILLSSGQLTDARVECSVDRGMSFIAINDQKTHVAMTYTIYFNISETTDYPLQFTIKSQPKATDASLAQHAELHPIDVTADGSATTEFYYSPWWVSEGALIVTLEEVIVEEPGIVSKVSDAFTNNPVLFVPVLMLVALGVVVLLRTKNAIDLELDMDDEVAADQHENGEFSALEDDEEVQEHQDDVRDENPSELDVSEIEERETVEDEPVRTRRKSVRPNTTSDGPITTVKRRRLDSNVTQTKEVTKRKTAAKKKVVTQAPATKKVKTRRVVTYANKESEENNADD